MEDNRRKRIAFIGIKGLPSMGGADRVVEGIVEGLADEYDISVYCGRSLSAGYDPKHIRLIKIRNMRGKHIFSFSLSLLSALHALLFRRFDLVHVHNTDSGFIVPLLRLKYKVVGTSHGFPYRREKWGRLARCFFKLSERLMFSFSAAVTCVSKPIAGDLAARYGKDVLFIPNGIDEPATVEEAGMFEKYRLGEKDYICFAAGRVDPTKGCHILLRAFEGLDRDMRVVAIGDFGHKKGYADQLHRMAGDGVTFIPFVSEREVLFGVVSRAKLFVFPSTVEAMSVMLLEVAALGVPMVCSDIRENSAVMEDRTTYFRSGDHEDLKDKIEHCLDRYDEVAAQARGTRDWVLENYNWRAVAAKYRALYEELTR